MKRRQTTSWASWLLLSVGVAGVALVVAVVTFGTMLGDDDIGTWYGHRTGFPGGDSVNGTAVLGNMFKQAGHRVHSWRYLSPKLLEADVIVWAPDRFEPPSVEVREWLEDWLDWGYGESRTLIYIGRDFDAAPLYWSKVQGGAPASQKAEVARRLAAAKTRYSSTRTTAINATKAATDDDEEAWFEWDTTASGRTVTSLSGPWSEGIDASKVEITLAGRLVPREEAEVLLASAGDALISRRRWETEYDAEATLIVVENGSFLLNLPLVNHEHRRLAGRLVDEVGPPTKRVVFLESGSSGPPIREQDAEGQTPSIIKYFSIWPINYVILHLAVLGVIFCFARLPIFGVPKELGVGSPTDFGRHVAALGRLLEKTNEPGYATARLRQYQQTLRAETSRSPTMKTPRQRQSGT